jgi:acetyltransferase-like isoleucine patch superfamily enzyme
MLGDGSTLSAFAHVSGAVKLGKGAYVGIHGCILPGVEVGDFAVVAAGSVVVKNVKPGTTVMGVPAKKIL